MNNYSCRLGTGEHDKSEGSSAMWTLYLKKWGSIDPLDPVALQPLSDKQLCATTPLNLCPMGPWPQPQTEAVTPTRTVTVILILLSIFHLQAAATVITAS